MAHTVILGQSALLYHHGRVFPWNVDDDSGQGAHNVQVSELDGLSSSLFGDLRPDPSLLWALVFPSSSTLSALPGSDLGNHTLLDSFPSVHTCIPPTGTY